MAGGKLSARQKMINLMYLVFISMLAMQMGKKVLSSFGRMNETLTDANVTTAKTNAAALSSLATLASDQPEKYAELNKVAAQLSGMSKDFISYMDAVKAKMLEKVKDPKDYEAMSNSNEVDELFFKDGKPTAYGNEFEEKIVSFREGVKNLLGKDFDSKILTKIDKRFNTNPDVHGKKGKRKEPWLESHFEGFPLISSVTNITKLQNDAETTENEVYGTLVGGQMKSDVSLKNYEAMVVFNKNAYYPGERLEGKIVLGKNDPTLTATKVIVNGAPVNKSNIQAGRVELSRSAGNVGEHELKGKFYFMENGEEIEIPIVGGKYSVIPMPNQAIISADKMNVVYRGLDNPISVSMPGVSSNKIKVSATGLSPNGKGAYIMRPPAAREVTIHVSATLPNGKNVKTSKLFRIKNIPSPTGLVRGTAGYQKMSKSSLLKSSIKSQLQDFVFDLKMGVASFKVKVPGKPAITCKGGSLSGEAKRAIGKAKRGDNVIFFDIKSVLLNNKSIKLKRTADCSVEITS
jgi:gliding motility-associated protein GldM